ncbi:peptidoglycan editing factor PgeF [Gracilimonas sp. Q87]|uniref:peptidoglycan editing factor PgeF n=1 Tax=Gracilimonas sp. Q87 TaxID=3384766 RepID=UPI003984139F
MSSRIEYIQPALLNGHGISSWFTLRNHQNVNQNSNIPGLNLGLNTIEPIEVVEHNRNLLLKRLKIEQHELAYAKQIHKTNIETVDTGGEYPDTDGLVTNERNLVLAIQVADCAAILLGDRKNHVIGAAHAGWRGAVDDICIKVIMRMKELGAESKQIKAFISPCISLKNFEVGEEVAIQFPSRYIDLTSYEKPHVDLNTFIKDQLMEQGIAEENIELSGKCTIDNEYFYSYRRQKNKSGRMMAMIKLN